MTRHRLLAAATAALLLAGCKGDDDASATETAEAIVTVGPENIAVATLVRASERPADLGLAGAGAGRHGASRGRRFGAPHLRRRGPAGEARASCSPGSTTRARAGRATSPPARRCGARRRRWSWPGGTRSAPSGWRRRARCRARSGDRALGRRPTPKGTLADARARLASAQEQLEDTEVRAPFDGIVSDRPADAGRRGAGGRRALHRRGSAPACGWRRASRRSRSAGCRPGTEVEFTVSGAGPADHRADRADQSGGRPGHAAGADLRHHPQRRAGAGGGPLRRGAGRDRHQAGGRGAAHRDRQPGQHADGAPASRAGGSPRARCSSACGTRPPSWSRSWPGVGRGRHGAARLGAGRHPGQPGAGASGGGGRVDVHLRFRDPAADRHRHRDGGAGGLRHRRAAQSAHRRVPRHPAADRRRDHPLSRRLARDGGAGDRRPDRGGVLLHQRARLGQDPGQRHRRPGAVHGLLRLREGHPGGVAGHPRRHLHPARRPAHRDGGAGAHPVRSLAAVGALAGAHLVADPGGRRSPGSPTR